MPATEQPFRVGETRALTHTITNDVAFVIDSVVANLYDANGSLVITDADGAVDSEDGAASHDISYLWTPASPGDYVYTLAYVVGTQTFLVRGEVTVLAVVSRFDRWVKRIAAWLLQSEVGEAQAELSYSQMVGAAQAALREFEQIKPRRVLQTYSLTANAFEYALPADWIKRFSYIYDIEYPVDDTAQLQYHLRDWQYGVDDLRGKWRFTTLTPGAGETARFYYAGRHRLLDQGGTGVLGAAGVAVTGTGTRFLSEVAVGDVIKTSEGFRRTVEAVADDTHLTVDSILAAADSSFTIEADTVPSEDFESVTQYAAGYALMMLANKAAQTSSPMLGAEMVNYRTKQREYSAQAKAMMMEAKSVWGPGGTSAVQESYYLHEHGRLIYWQTG